MFFYNKSTPADACRVLNESLPSRRRPAIASLCATAFAVGLAAIATPTLAQLLPLPSPQVTEYPLPNLAAGPCEIEFDRNGFLWIEEVTGNAIGRFDPRNGSFVTFPLAQPLAVPGGMEIGPDGALWFVQIAANVVTRLDPSDGSMQSFPIPTGQLVGGSINAGTALASDITTGKDGAMWFTMSGTSAVGRIDIVTKQIEIIPLPTPFATTVVVTQIIQPGPGNTLVISLAAVNKIATIDVFSRQIREYTMPTPASLPQGVTTDRHGDIWFTQTGAQKFGRLNVSTGAITEYNILALRGLSLDVSLPFPGPIRQGSDGKIYIAEGGFQGGNKIAQFDPVTHAFKEFVVPTLAAGMCDINSTRNGEIWFGELRGNKIGKVLIH